MKKQIFAIFTRTPLHVGAGNSVGAIDSPVMRERHTRIPIIPGSSLKGVLADLWNDENFKRTSDGEELFGKTDSKAAKAGQLLVGESRVLAFPVRSAKSRESLNLRVNVLPKRYIQSPYILALAAGLPAHLLWACKLAIMAQQIARHGRIFFSEQLHQHEPLARRGTLIQRLVMVVARPHRRVVFQIQCP